MATNNVGQMVTMIITMALHFETNGRPEGNRRRTKRTKNEMKKNQIKCLFEPSQSYWLLLSFPFLLSVVTWTNTLQSVLIWTFVNKRRLNIVVKGIICIVWLIKNIGNRHCCCDVQNDPKNRFVRFNTSHTFTKFMEYGMNWNEMHVYSTYHQCDTYGTRHTAHT